MTGQDPSPQTTLLILLGASSWPDDSDLPSSAAFENAVRDLQAYFLLDPNGFHLPKSNRLDLFNSNDYGPDILNQISDFLRGRIKTNADVRDVLVYFVGHGGLTTDSSTFYLAIRRTRKNYEKATSIAIEDLAERLKKGARFQRRILILDCCFAAAAMRFLQGAATTVLLREKTIAAFEEKDQGIGFPSRGTSLLGSSGKNVASIILPDESSTMFTSALLSTLRAGDPFQEEKERLPLHTVHRLTIDVLSKTYGDNFPLPELHSPDQAEGKVEDVPFFPNPAAVEAEERVRLEEEWIKTKEEQARCAEKEQPPSFSPARALVTSEALIPLPPTNPRFAMSLYQVTNREFQVFLDANTYWRRGGRCQYDGKVDSCYLAHWMDEAKNIPDYPVVNVSWYAAEAYVNWLSEQRHQRLRLPTQEEWEIAARCGRTSKEWWREEIEKGRVNYSETEGEIRRVSSFGANPYGFYNILGNAYELCSSGQGGIAGYGGASHSSLRELTTPLPLEPHECREDVSFRFVQDLSD